MVRDHPLPAFRDNSGDSKSVLQIYYYQHREMLRLEDAYLDELLRLSKIEGPIACGVDNLRRPAYGNVCKTRCTCNVSCHTSHRPCRGEILQV